MQQNINQQTHNPKFIESLDYLLQLTKSHFSFLSHPICDLEDKVTSTNHFLQQFFKVLGTGLASLSKDIQLDNFIHLLAFKNFVGLKDRFNIDYIKSAFRQNCTQYEKTTQTTETKNLIDNNYFEPVMGWKQRYPLLEKFNEISPFLENKNIETLDLFIVAAMRNQDNQTTPKHIQKIDIIEKNKKIYGKNKASGIDFVNKFFRMPEQVYQTDQMETSDNYQNNLIPASQGNLKNKQQKSILNGYILLDYYNNKIGILPDNDINKHILDDFLKKSFFRPQTSSLITKKRERHLQNIINNPLCGVYAKTEEIQQGNQQKSH